MVPTQMSHMSQRAPVSTLIVLSIMYYILCFISNKNKSICTIFIEFFNIDRCSIFLRSEVQSANLS